METVQQSSYTTHPTWRSSNVLAAHTRQSLDDGFSSICSTAASLHISSMRLIFTWLSLRLNPRSDMSSKEAQTTSTTYDATREPHVRYICVSVSRTNHCHCTVEPRLWDFGG